MSFLTNSTTPPLFLPLLIFPSLFSPKHTSLSLYIYTHRYIYITQSYRRSGEREREEMGNGYHHHHLHHQRSTFLPMLCSRPSIKDVQLPKWQDQERSSSFSGDPSSPRVSCMGQVKRNNRVIGFPTSYNRFTTPAPRTATTIKYHKLKRLFSGKNLPAATATSASRRGMVVGSARGTKLSASTSDDRDNESCAPELNIAELDPPLPVVKRAAESRDEVSLWRRRRSGRDGRALKTLQLQQIHLPNNHYSQPPTV